MHRPSLPLNQRSQQETKQKAKPWEVSALHPSSQGEGQEEHLGRHSQLHGPEAVQGKESPEVSRCDTIYLCLSLAAELSEVLSLFGATEDQEGIINCH